MTQEEKAKRYDEALGRARNIHKDAVEMENTIITKTCQVIFPELEESEGERIRKFLHNTFTEEYLSEDKLSKWHGELVSNILAWLEKQGEQKPFDYENANIQQKDFAPKVESKFKVKYANSEYDVLEIKDIAGVKFYGIEDEPNHIDYVQAENCEIIGGYGIKKNGDSFPNKPIMFSEHNPAWSEEDENEVTILEAYIRNRDWSKSHVHRALGIVDELVKKLKSLKPQNTWKPNSEQLAELRNTFAGCSYDLPVLESLYNDIIKL